MLLFTCSIWVPFSIFKKIEDCILFLFIFVGYIELDEI